MIITISKNAGFCSGVRKAVNLANDLSKTENICTYGDLIHNKHVINNLNSKGVFSIDNLAKVKENQTVLIRTHGIPKNDYVFLNENKIKYYDATCPFVKNIHRIVKKEYDANRKIIIIGDATHPEIIGINSWANNSAIIINDNNFVIENLDEKYSVVVQTTYSSSKYDTIKKTLSGICKNVVFFNTICYTTKERQDEAELLSKEHDCVLVIGDKKSANTNKLLEITKKHCLNSHLISDIEDLDDIKKQKIKKLAIVAGASTSDELIQEVKSIMSETQNPKNDLVEEKDIKSETKTQETKSVEKAENIDSNLDSKILKKSDRTYPKPRKDSTNKVKVIMATDEDIKVQINPMYEGSIPKDEISIDENFVYNPKDYVEGQELKAKLIKFDPYTLSIKRIEEEAEKAKKALEMLTSNNFKIKITKIAGDTTSFRDNSKNKNDEKTPKEDGRNHKGLIGYKHGIEVFIPRSQIKLGFVKGSLRDYVGKELEVKCLPIIEKVVEKDAETGDTIETTYIKPIEEFIKETQEKGKRIRNIRASARIVLEEELAKKQELFWENVFEGAKVEGTVKRFTEFGAFVRVFDFDCLAHISDLSHIKIKSADEVLELDKKYEFLVLRVDKSNGRVGLGYKQLQKSPIEIAKDKYPIGTVLEGKVQRIFKFGIFVELEPGVDGLVPIGEVSHKWVEDPESLFKKDEVVKVEVIDFNDNKLTLSIKSLLVAPEQNEAEGQTETANDPTNDTKTSKPKKSISNDKFNITKASFDRKKSSRRTNQDNQNVEPVTHIDETQTSTTLGDLFKDILDDIKKD